MLAVAVGLALLTTSEAVSVTGAAVPSSTDSVSCQVPSSVHDTVGSTAVSSLNEQLAPASTLLCGVAVHLMVSESPSASLASPSREMLGPSLPLYGPPASAVGARLSHASPMPSPSVSAWFGFGTLSQLSMLSVTPSPSLSAATTTLKLAGARSISPPFEEVYSSCSKVMVASPGPIGVTTTPFWTPQSSNWTMSVAPTAVATVATDGSLDFSLTF